MNDKLIINDALLRQNGINLPDRRDREYLLSLLQEEYETRIRDELCRGLTLEQCEEFALLQGDKQRLWLEEHVPDHAERVARAGASLREEIRLQRRRILEVVGGPELDLTLDDMELPVRFYNCLTRAGIHTVRDILSRSREEILSLRNFPAKKIGILEEQIYYAIFCRDRVAD